MPDERRGSKRAHITGVRVTYESASGERVEADALDLSTGGLFVRTSSPLGVGKRITIDIQVVGEPTAWSALGRVVWVRPHAAPGMPSGMGVKLIDVDEAVVAAIDHLVETREPTSPGVGAGVRAEIAPVAPIVCAPPVPVPERERTLMGVGAAEDEKPVETRPHGVRVAAPAREPLGREGSIAIDLVSKRPASTPPPRGSSRAPARVQPQATGAGGRWIVIMLLLVVAGIAGYVLLDGFLRPPGR